MTANRALWGRDLLLHYRHGGFFEDADLVAASGLAGGSAGGAAGDSAGGSAGPGRLTDLAVASEVDAAVQAVANRLKTRMGELAPLGHADYGSRHHELMGQPNVGRTRNLIKLYVLQALRREPRIEKVLRCDVTAAHTPPREVVRIVLALKLIGVQAPANLVVPFSLEAS
jgi:phage baseplate assembly protein W